MLVLLAKIIANKRDLALLTSLIAPTVCGNRNAFESEFELVRTIRVLVPSRRPGEG